MGDCAGPAPDPADAGAVGDVAVGIETLPVLSWALARAGVRLVSRLAVTLAPGCRPVRGALVQVAVRTADGALAAPVELTADLGPGRTVLTDVPLRLDPQAMARGTRTSGGTVEVRVSGGGRELGRGVTGVRVLAPADWLAAPAPLSLETLAAHVRPADPALATLVGAASDLIEGRTGDHPLPSAGSGPERVDERAAAIVEAVRRRAVRLDPGPADWAADPQRVRTPTEVLDGRVGSCLDTVVVVAAAFEQAGIRPLLWVTEDHAFLGYWRIPACAEAAATTAVDGLVELVESGAIQLVETTMLTADAEPATFGDLHRTPQAAWLSGDAARVVGVVDVHRARLDGVRPLPVGGPADGEAVDGGRQRGAPRRRAAGAGCGEAPPPVERWKADLLDADPSPTPAPALRLALTVPGAALAALGDRVSAGTALTVLPADQLGALQRERGDACAADLPPEELAELLVGHAGVHVDVPGSGYPELLRSLATATATATTADGPAGRGGDRLVLTLGSVLADVDDRPERTPLLLVPVVLTPTPSTGAYALALDPTGTSRLDPRLLSTLRRRHGVHLPTLAELGRGAAPVDAVLRAAREALTAADLPLLVEPTAELAVLPSAPSRLWADLDEHWAEFAAAPLVAHLAHDRPGPLPHPPPAAPADDDLDELAAALPLPADASQLRAVAAARAGGTFVLAGAPGTGTTQTVANLVARSIGDGRRVLVVAADGTALDDLAERLATTGLAPLVADLRPGAVAPPATAPASPGRPHPADPAGELRGLREQLTGYARRLHEPDSAGLSLYAARCGVLPVDPDLPVLPVRTLFAGSASVRTVAAIRSALGDLPRLAAPAGPQPGHPWGFLDRPAVEPVAVQAAVVALDRAVDGLPPTGPLADLLAAVRTVDELEVLAAVLADLVDAPAVPLAVLDDVLTAEQAAAADVLLRSVDVFAATVHPGLEVAVPEVLDLPLEELAAAARAAAAASLLSRGRRLAAVLAELAPALVPGARVAPAELPALLDDLRAAQTAARALAARAAGLPGLRVPPSWNPLTDPALVEHQVARLRRLAAAAGPATPFTGPLRRFLAAGSDVDAAHVAAVVQARDAVTGLSAACAVQPGRLAAWAGDGGLVARWTATRAGRAVDTYGLPSLHSWRGLLTGLELLPAAGLDAAREDLLSGVVPAADAVAAFDRGLAAAAVAERQSTTGLGAADGEAQEAAARRFSAVSAAARAAVVADLADRAADLAGALTGAEPAAFPCVLADPESVARSLPATAGLFDLVVFEGASSLRVAEAIGALGRARTAVVAGDDSQLPPRADAPADPADAAESLLDACARAGLPRLELGWQHRSSDETLFAFSNAHHYGGRIRTVPSPGGGRAVSLVRVAGTFHRSGTLPGTNPAEARAVVAEVRRRFDASPGAAPSIAVVTLHPQQRALVERLLRDAGDDRLAAALDSAELAVSHVEDVPGLVRDVVLLSLGCSAAAGDGRVPGDFGPLARAGGERRLNVAVTRARRQVVVYASFDPEQLHPEETSALGVRQLRAYLDLAVSGPEAVPQAGRRPDAHREDVAAALRQRGLVVRTDVGLSGFRVDLTVARPSAPEAPVLAVLLDGAVWARRGTVTDRDGVPADVLGGRSGWPAVERLWLPSWLADRDGELARLGAAVECATAPPAAPLAPLPAAAATPLVGEPPAARAPSAARGAAHAEPPTAAPVRVTARPAVPPALLVGERPFVPWTPKPAWEPLVFRRLTDPDVARQVRRVLAAGIAAEGPVHRERLARLTAGAFGVARVNEARRESILALLPDPAAEFRWPKGLDRATWTGFRRQASSGDRPLEHVHPDEVGNAMVALCRAAGDGMTRDELFARTLAVFGHRRRHPVLMPYLEVALAHAVRASRVVREPAGRLISAA